MPRNKTISDTDLLARCRATFLAEGLGVSTRRLAAAAGVSEGVLFQRFKTKDALFFRAMRLPRPDLAEALARVESLGTVEGLTALATAAMRYLRGQMPALLLVLSHPAYLSRTPPADVLMDARALSAPFAQFLSRRRSPPADPGAVVELILALLLTRTIHEAMGVQSRRGTAAWLRRTIGALAAGFPTSQQDTSAVAD